TAPTPVLYSFPTRRSSDLFLIVRSDLLIERPVMDDGTSPHGMGDTLIPLEPAIIDDRGEIQPLLEAHIRSALLISSRKGAVRARSEEHTSELQSRENLVCR